MTFSEYKDKRVVVTGASSGIGLATARALVALGAEVHGLSRSKPDLDLASFVPLDLSDPISIESAVSAIGGRVDSLFNCAGAVPMIAAADIMKINFLGTRLLTEGLLELMPSGSAIVSTSSDGGYGWRNHLALTLEFLEITTFDGGLAWYEANQASVGHAYAYGKEALNVWTMQQSAVLIGRGIRINVTSPGAVQTPMLEAIEGAYGTAAIQDSLIPSGRRSSAEEQVGALLFLNSESASYITGINLPVDGGHASTLDIKTP